jgi:hypothetical protein
LKKCPALHTGTQAKSLSGGQKQLINNHFAKLSIVERLSFEEERLKYRVFLNFAPKKMSHRDFHPMTHSDRPAKNRRCEGYLPYFLAPAAR